MKVTPKPDDEAITQAASLYPVGSVTDATVVSVYPFGLVLDLPDAERAGFLKLPYVDPDDDPVDLDSGPAPREGDRVRVVVIAHEIPLHQLVVSRRRDHFPTGSTPAERGGG